MNNISLIAVLVGLSVLSACSNSNDINRFMDQRKFVVYADQVTIDDPDPSQIHKGKAQINDMDIPVTSYVFTSEDIARSAGMAQLLDIHHNTRLLGIRFSIRSLSGNCSLIPVLASAQSSPNNWVRNKHLQLETSSWKQVVLTFRDFTDTRSQMYLDVDTFQPGNWNFVNLFLLPYGDTKKDMAIEWGPVEPVYQNHRYRFY
ncbi:hypothetical protein K8T06_15600 [bacterium]|nr:hypothetical protein [bacterium]